jgi:hypothetical protein
MMTDRAGDAQRVGGKGKLIVAVIVLLAVVGVVWFALGRDDMRSTPVEDAVAGRAIGSGVPDPTDSDPGLASPESGRPQGRSAPDSNEGVVGSPSQTGDPASAAGGASGRNAPAPPGADAQNAPDGSLTSGPDRAPASTAPSRP